MKYNIVASLDFARDLKHFLAKRYPSVKRDVTSLTDTLRENPTVGTPLGDDCFKIRFVITSKGRGKSGGGRMITCVKIVDKTVYLLTVYDKSEQETVTDKELAAMLKSLGLKK